MTAFFAAFSLDIARYAFREKPPETACHKNINQAKPNERFGFNPMAYGLFAARHHLHPQRGVDLRLRDPGDLDGTAQSGLPFELKIADLTQDGAHAKCATKPLTGARYHDTATEWGLYLLFIMPIGSCPGRATGCTCSCLARKARAGYAFFPPSHFRHFVYFCAADFTDKISAGGFLPLFVGRCPTLNATRPLALEHEWAKDILPLQACPPLHFQLPIIHSQLKHPLLVSRPSSYSLFPNVL